MPHRTDVHQPRALHERAIDMAVILIDRQQSCPLRLEEVAEALGEPLERVKAMFPDIDALMVAVVEQALVILIDTCTRIVVKADPNDPVAQFRALGDAYLDWADAHQAQFRIISDYRMLNLLALPDLRRYVDSLTELMIRMLKRARDEGYLHPKEDIELIVLSSHCYAYGLARMIVDGRMAQWAPGAPPLVTAKKLAQDFVLRVARSSQPTRGGT